MDRVRRIVKCAGESIPTDVDELEALLLIEKALCRYMSGPIFQHPLLKDLDYYWRLEPETKHLCTLNSHWRQVEGRKPEWVERDPFRYMRDNKKKYGWFMTMSEYRTTVMSLMLTTNSEYPFDSLNSMVH
jgi:alpha 1,2-mannosyltransferase